MNDTAEQVDRLQSSGAGAEAELTEWERAVATLSGRDLLEEAIRQVEAMEPGEAAESFQDAFNDFIFRQDDAGACEIAMMVRDLAENGVNGGMALLCALAWWDEEALIEMLKQPLRDLDRSHDDAN